MRNINAIKNLAVVLILFCLGTSCISLTSVIAANDPIWPPIPGNMKGDQPIIEVGDIQPISRSHPQITGVTRNVDIVSLITQINESMILSYLQDLVSFGPRVTGETSCEQAAQYLYDEFAGMGLEVRYHNWEYGGYTSQNVEATLPGKAPNSTGIYIICGHYDTVAEAPGADDDASGVVAALVAAKLMSQLEFNFTIRFVAFSGEEEGLFGSEMYVEDAFNNGDNIKGVLNADMIGFALNEVQAGSMQIFEDDLSEWLFTYTSDVEQIYDDYIDLDLIHSGFTWGSDHYYFWEYGYSALFYHEFEFNHYYHSSEDTIANMNLTYDVKGTRLLIATLASLAQANASNSPPITPSIQGSHYGQIDEDLTFSIGPITDPDGDELFALFDWGDGSQSGWLGPYTSGLIISEKHSWSEPGLYEIRVKLRDTNGAVSNWSEPFLVYITSKMILLGLVQDVNSSGDVTSFTLRRGVSVAFNPFDMQRYSNVLIFILNNETKGYLGSRVIIGQFYAVVLVI